MGGGEPNWSPEWTPEDAAFHDRLADITAAVGRGLAIGIPALFLIGLFLAPFRGVIPSAVVLTVIIVGAFGLVVLVERLRGTRRRAGGTGPLIGRRALTIFLIGLAAWLILVSAIALRA